jgi:trimeric autotransporter adhesin
VQSTGTVRDTMSLSLSRLQSCKGYAVRVRAKCSATLFSEWRTSTFTTLGCPPPCAAPHGLFVAARDSSASLNWLAVGTGVTYVVQYKTTRDSVYRTVNATTNSLNVDHLLPCTEYTFRVKTVCSATASSDYSESVRFKTLGCAAPCITPREVRAVTEGTNKINLAWLGTSILGYEIQFRIRDSAWSASTRVTTLTYQLTNTRTCTPYSFRVRAVCAQTGTTLLYSEWSATASVVSAGCVVTPRCDPPKRLSYVPANTTTLVRWDSLPGAGITYEVQWMGARDSGAWHTISGVRSASTTITGLTVCSVYMFRVKTNCSATSSSNWSEPVRFQTIGCTPLCSKPKNLKAFVNDSVVVFSWDRADLTAYKLTVSSVDGSFASRTIAVTGFNYTLTGLLRCKAYVATLTTSCTDGRTSESATVGFTTVTRTCVTNTNCKVEQIGINTTNDSTVIEANATVLGVTYEIQYRKAVDTAWSASISATRPRFVLRGLIRCTNYVVRVRAICTTGAGDWKTAEFRAGAACFANGDGDVEYLLGSSSITVSSFAVYPNPGHDALGLSYKLEQDATVNVQLVNLQGQVVSELNGGLQEAGNYNQTLDNLGNLNDGLYMLVVRANGKVLATQKWTKQ